MVSLEGPALCDEGRSSSDHVGKDAGYLVPLPRRLTTRLLLQDNKDHEVLWMYLGVRLQELVEPYVYAQGALGEGLLAVLFRCRSSTPPGTL